MRDSNPCVLFLSAFFHLRSGSFGMWGGIRVEVMLYTVLICPFESVVVVFVFFGLSFVGVL
jgi:hypothetical protein